MFLRILMQIICPKCQFKRDVDSSKLPANTSHATCPKCFEKFSLYPPNPSFDKENTVDSNALDTEVSETIEEERRQRAHSIYKEELERANKDDSHYENDENNEHIKNKQDAYNNGHAENIQYVTMVPWEIAGKHPSLFYKFYHTLLRIFTSAPLFFATMLRTYPMQKAILFYIIIGGIQFIVKMLFFQFSATELVSDTPEIQAFYSLLTDPRTLLVGTLISPFILYLQLHFISFLFLLTIKLVQPQSANYALIVRIVSYSSAAGLVSVVPVIGDYISIPWMVFNFLLACRFTLQMNMLKASLTVLAFTLFSLALLFFIFPML